MVFIDGDLWFEGWEFSMDSESVVCVPEASCWVSFWVLGEMGLVLAGLYLLDHASGVTVCSYTTELLDNPFK